MRRFLKLLAILLAALLAAPAQDAPRESGTQNDTRSIERLQTLMPALEAAEAELEALEERLVNAATEGEKAGIAQEVSEQREQVETLRDNFLTIATGVEESRYERLEGKGPSWEENLEDIIAPISREVRQMTAGAREMEQLRNDFKDWQERKEMAEAASARVQRLRGLAESETVRAELEEAQKLWSNRLAEASSQTEVLRQKMEEREAESPSTWEAVSSFFAEFWRSRGFNLLLALVLAVMVFVAARRGYRLVRRVSPFHRKGGHNLAARSLDLAWAGIAGLLAALAVILVFYLRNDWLLLAIAILFILGILWASKRAVPPYLEQLRLILNLGPVRQGERLVYEGVPWRVDRLHFYCEFRNPALDGALLRLPVRDVLPLHSRPPAPKEQWFPTTADDWVILADGTFGKVIQQSPEQVVVLRLGGSLKTYPTAEFLTQTPENLSRGFRINTTFGIDYQHQAICTTEVPEVMKLTIERVLLERVSRENLRSLKVEFAGAGPSSLDYAILADFDGEVASRLNILERLIQKTCVDVCNERGWVIPFTQVTVHQANRAAAGREPRPAARQPPEDGAQSGDPGKKPQLPA